MPRNARFVRHASGYGSGTMLTRCAEPGCETFVLGGCCLEHEYPQTRIFVRGRPFVAVMPTDARLARPRIVAHRRLAGAIGSLVTAPETLRHGQPIDLLQPL
jgi:hypothetical protein